MSGTKHCFWAESEAPPERAALRFPNIPMGRQILARMSGMFDLDSDEKGILPFSWSRDFGW
jgi:hypothetical protein